VLASRAFSNDADPAIPLLTGSPGLRVSGRHDRRVVR
jgi:hypothetical protein